MAGKKEAFRFFLRKSFDLRAGEYTRALLMQAYIFLIISTLLMIKPTVNALFLSKFGVENLPFAFILVAIFAGIVSTLYAKILTKVSLNKIISGTLIGSVICLLLFGILLRLNIFEEIVLYLLYIFVAIFALLTASQFWVLANLVFNAREAKRLFSFVGAGAIAGGIFGGYLTSVLAQIMSSENLPFVCAVILSFCIPITRKVWRENVANTQTQFQQKKRTKVGTSHPLALILKSKHLTYIACIVGVSVIVAKLVDYQFGGVASAMIPDADELTVFFGFWFSTFNVISLLMQLFLTRRVVGMFGVGTSLFFLPTLILIAAIVLLIAPEMLMAAVFLKMSDGSLKQSVNKAAMELLILPLPVELKSQTKTFIDVFVDSVATGISGLILIFIIDGLDLSTYAISLLIILLLLVWLYFANLVRKEYLKSFKLKLSEPGKISNKKVFDISNESVLGGLQKVLEQGKEKQILFALAKTKELNLDRFFESTQKLLQHESSDIRTAALQSLYFYSKHNISEEVKKMTNDPFQKVKIAAFEYLIQRSPENKVHLINQYLEDKDDKIKGAALVSVAKETRGNLTQQNQFGLEKRIQEQLNMLPHISNLEIRNHRRLGVIKAIGYANIPTFFSYLKTALWDESKEVNKHAILAAGKTLSPVFIEDLIRLLANVEQKESTILALNNYGKSIVITLKNKFQDGDIGLESLRVVPSVIKKNGTQEAVDFLFELFDYDDHVVRLEAVRGLNMLRNNFPYLKFSKKNIVHSILDEANLFQDTLSVLYVQSSIIRSNNTTEAEDQAAKEKDGRDSLIYLLEKKLDRNLERIFRLLGLKYESEDIVAIYKGLKSNKPDFRVNAVEFLDNLLEPNLKKILIPIVETAMVETITEEAIKNLAIKIPDEFQCFSMLMKGRDLRIKISVLYLIAQLDNPRYLPLAKEYSTSKNEKIRTFAEAILKKN
ncbi:MAG: Npt1/Npt2 family nucleotide transporter [Saprospiraceae bacterium]